MVCNLLAISDKGRRLASEREQVGLIPRLDCGDSNPLIRREWKLLLAMKFWIGIPAVLLIVAPWYYAVTRINGWAFLYENLFLENLNAYGEGYQQKRPWYFYFKETPDPISLQQSFGQLSPYFQTDSRTSYAFSNSIMSQQGARAGERFQPADAGDASASRTDSISVRTGSAAPVSLREPELSRRCA